MKTSAFGLGFQHLRRDLANVNAWKTMFDPYIRIFVRRTIQSTYLFLSLSPLTTYVIRTFRILEVTPSRMVECSKCNCKSCIFQSHQNASRCTTNVSNRAFLQHDIKFPIFLLILQSFRSNMFRLTMWCIWSKCFR